MYRPSGYNRIFCVAVSTELRCFEMPSLRLRYRDNVACCACARIPDGALGKIIATSEQRALACCQRDGAVCICNTINFSTKSFIINDRYEPRNVSYIALCIKVCPYIYLLKFLMNQLFSSYFQNNYYSPGLADHMRPVISAVRPASAGCCGLCHPIDWWSRDCKKRRAAPFTENIPVFRWE